MQCRFSTASTRARKQLVKRQKTALDGPGDCKISGAVNRKGYTSSTRP